MINKYTVENRVSFNIISIIGIILLLVSLLFSDYLSVLLQLKPNITTTNSTQVHFIDVGQGDAIAIKFSNGKTMLVDSGLSEYKSKLFYYLDNVVLKHSNTIDYLVLTHPDEDHMGNMLDIVNKYNIDAFYRPMIFAECENDLPTWKSNKYSELISTLKLKNINMKYAIDSENFSFDNVKVRFLTALDIPDIITDSTNAYSPVIVIEDNGKRVMLTGDIDSRCESMLMDKYNIEKLDIDILKLAHHGSNSSTSLNFLETTTPSNLVVSVGENTYGHPSNDVLLRILEYDKIHNSALYNNIYTTKIDGNIIATLSNDIYFETIDNIDNYSFYSYSIYAVIGIMVMLYYMLLPYYKVWKKNLRYTRYNKQYSQNK